MVPPATMKYRQLSHGDPSAFNRPDSKVDKKRPPSIAISASGPMSPKPTQSIHTLVTKYKVDEITAWVNQNKRELDPLNADQLSPLMLAAKLKFNDVCEIFLTNGANKALPGFHNRTALHIAAQTNNLRLARLVVNPGMEIDPKINPQDNDGNTPLILASLEGHQNMVTLLLLMGADPKITDKKKRHPLHIAIENGHIELAKFLIPLTTEVINARDSYGNTALSIAKNKGHNDIAKILKENGATDDTVETSKNKA